MHMSEQLGRCSIPIGLVLSGAIVYDYAGRVRVLVRMASACARGAGSNRVMLPIAYSVTGRQILRVHLKRLARSAATASGHAIGNLSIGNDSALQQERGNRLDGSSGHVAIGNCYDPILDGAWEPIGSVFSPVQTIRRKDLGLLSSSFSQLFCLRFGRDCLLRIAPIFVNFL